MHLNCATGETRRRCRGVRRAFFRCRDADVVQRCASCRAKGRRAGGRRSGQMRSDQIRSGRRGSNRVESSRVECGQVRPVRSREVRSGQVRPGQTKSGAVAGLSWRRNPEPTSKRCWEVGGVFGGRRGHVCAWGGEIKKNKKKKGKGLKKERARDRGERRGIRDNG